MRCAALVIAAATACGRLDFAPVAGGDAALACHAALCPDLAFGSGGVVTYALPGVSTASYGYGAIAVAPDDSLVLAGQTATGSDQDLLALRLAPSGALAPAFGSGGAAALDAGSASETALGVALDASGSVLLAGASGGQPIVARLTPSGAADSTFGGGGIARPAIGGGTFAALNGLAFDSANRIVAVGQAGYASTGFDVLAVRLTASGGSDPTFGSGGYVASDLHGHDEFAAPGGLGAGDRVYAVVQTFTATAGFDGAVLRLRADGSRDPAFGSGGVAETDLGGAEDRYFAMILDAQARPVVAGASKGATATVIVARYTAAGALDPAFGAGGLVQLARGSGGALHALAELPDGRLVAGGIAGEPAALAPELLLLAADGSVLAEGAFGMTGDVRCLRLDHHGRLVVLGGTPQPDGATALVVRRFVIP